jgi:hypothetical protein
MKVKQRGMKELLASKEPKTVLDTDYEKPIQHHLEIIPVDELDNNS